MRAVETFDSLAQLPRSEAGCYLSEGKRKAMQGRQAGSTVEADLTGISELSGLGRD